MVREGRGVHSTLPADDATLLDQDRVSEGEGETTHFTEEFPSEAQGELEGGHRLSSPKRKRRKLFQVRAENTPPSTSPQKEKVSRVRTSPTKSNFKEGREAHSTLPADDATLLDQDRVSEGEGDTPHFTEESPSKAQGELEGRHRLSSPKRKRQKLFQIRAGNTPPSTSPQKEKVSRVRTSPTKSKFKEGREAHSTLPANDATLLDQDRVSEGEGDTPHFTEESPSKAQGELEDRHRLSALKRKRRKLFNVRAEYTPPASIFPEKKVS